MGNVLFTRGNTATINATPITDGQILYNTTAGTQYLDNGTTRIQIGQNITVDAVLNVSSSNPIANSGVAGVMYTSLSDISVITQSGSLPDALAVKELNNKLIVHTGTLTAGQTSITISDSSITTNSILDFYTSIYGVNPSTVTVSSGNIVLTFSSQATDMLVGVGIKGVI